MASESVHHITDTCRVRTEWDSTDLKLEFAEGEVYVALVIQGADAAGRIVNALQQAIQDAAEELLLDPSHDRPPRLRAIDGGT
ncbi:hypothetical protein BC739_001698 [Kutzneria viridogrisea]|uniref:Uncharacterized protein n=1 Tax=Kutzneria viridogrisea TaxID=47990 RepID=A0ABR6BCQ4_9PSEU|nr:hypothetical protein [Kutzneria viridogrisea]